MLAKASQLGVKRSATLRAKGSTSGRRYAAECRNSRTEKTPNSSCGPGERKARIREQLDAARAAQIIAALKPHRARSEAVAACIRHCEANRDRMRYDLCQKRGLPVGSVIVEGVCKRIIGNQFKQSGCHWSKAGTNNVLASGCCLENTRWTYFLDWRACRAAAA